MDELTVNLHMHTTYSDGSGTHADLAQAALRTGVDVLLVTDHNVWVQGVDAYHHRDGRRVLVLAGEEIHDQGRVPQKNHMLVFGANRELSRLGDDPQRVINAVQEAGGICFLAHPIDPALPAFGETDISWVDWHVHGYTGIELWNGFSEFKVVAKSTLDGVFYAFFPEFLGHGPVPELLTIWDGLLEKGQRVVAVGGSDAHALHKSLGPLHKIVFPYEFHFSSVNTHLLVPEALTGDLAVDRRTIYTALASGHCFIGYDLPASTRGFRFSAHGLESGGIMGDEVPLGKGLTLQVKLPKRAEIRLLKNGQLIKTAHAEALTHVVTEAGAYRVESYRPFLGKRRGWIFSNPIYVRA